MWQEQNKTLSKTFTFDDFKSALAFVNDVGNLAEKANHHPEIELSWGKVVINITTHSAGNITQKDTELAKQIDLL
jgi:4a-hydroxytetrahydrobiopterin dehydratase